MPLPLLLKTAGYFVSALSVLLLGAVAWKSAEQDSTVLLLLVLGMATSVAGMGFRWASSFQDQRERGNI
jgi:hypothetical protein